MRAIAAALLLLGCATAPIEGPPKGLQFSLIDIGVPDARGFEVLDTVAAGSVTLTFFTFGSSSCTRPAGVSIERTSNTVTITSYDETVDRSAICTADLRTFRRNVAVLLDPGPVFLRLRGRGETGPTLIDRVVWVEP